MAKTAPPRLTIQRHFIVRHTPTGVVADVWGFSLRLIRRKIEAECADRGWLLEDVDWFEVKQ